MNLLSRMTLSLLTVGALVAPVAPAAHAVKNPPVTVAYVDYDGVTGTDAIEDITVVGRTVLVVATTFAEGAEYTYNNETKVATPTKPAAFDVPTTADSPMPLTRGTQSSATVARVHVLSVL